MKTFFFLNKYQVMSNQKKIAKNSIFLTLRMLITMGITLLTSRYILKNLGVEEFGIYGVVAGILGLFSFIQSTLVGASARFFSYELGKENNIKKLQQQLNISITIHLIFSIIILLLAELIGIYVVNQIIHYKEEYRFEVNILYQITILNSIIIFLGLPFEAVLTSLERFKSYAYIKIFDTVAKFTLAYYIFYAETFKLVYYGLGLLLITVLVNLLYYYCSKVDLKGYRYKWINSKEKLKPILHFFSLDLYGNLSIVLQSHGINVLQNLFFGPIANASILISNQIHTALGSFSNNVLIATKPQIIKAYASEDYFNFNQLINLATKISFLVSLIVSIPIFFNLDYILELWLINPPLYTKVYGELAILINLLTISLSTINFAIHATGNIKWISFISGSLFMLILPITYLAFKLNYPTQSSYYIALVISLIVCFVNVWILKNLVSEFNLLQFLATISRMIIGGILLFLASYWIQSISISSNYFINFILQSSLQVLLTLFVFISIVINSKERGQLQLQLNKFFKK